MELRQDKSLATGVTIQRMILRILCVFVLSGILVAGLWPFHGPKNQVSWLSNGNGLLFGDYGSLLSARGFKSSRSTDGACLEIWLEPSVLDDSGTILSFDPPEHGSTSLALRQSWDDLELQLKKLDTKRSTRSARIYADHVFRGGKPVFLTINSGDQGTSIYVNGMLVRMSRDFRFSIQDLNGQLVIGNSSVTTDTWSGQLKGLAIYNRELTASQVVQHYQTWLGSGHPVISVPDRAIALYLFNEGRGHVIKDQLDSATDLLIPERFFVLHEPFLERPWNEYYPGWHYWKDVAVNIGGFIPLGFVFYAYFSRVRRLKRAAAVTIAFGFAVSLTIEVLQAFLPTRSSGMTDLITNTFGTALGAMLCAWSAGHARFAQGSPSIVSSTAEKIAETSEDLQLVK